MRRGRPHGKGERGSTLVEFTIGALVFLTAIFGVLEFSRLLFTHNALSDSVRRAARYAVSHASARMQARTERLDGLRLQPAAEGERLGQVPVSDELK